LDRFQLSGGLHFIFPPLLFIHKTVPGTVV
jgi:hypothetical protein